MSLPPSIFDVGRSCAFIVACSLVIRARGYTESSFGESLRRIDVPRARDGGWFWRDAHRGWGDPTWMTPVILLHRSPSTRCPLLMTCDAYSDPPIVVKFTACSTVF
ncbi:hypothetical protein ARMSODRAFT_967949 [Armillaria solidipes]|uniref:Uncharacterized protein n=1 Tax=Armillaria solidipes TaxID=1076256 RepID=A0A2H3AGT7_9AGAR|nr:hypothetical protein ARMSODRAFT_967949 [Armillaria solidipes]